MGLHEGTAGAERLAPFFLVGVSRCTVGVAPDLVGDVVLRLGSFCGHPGVIVWRSL